MSPARKNMVLAIVSLLLAGLLLYETTNMPHNAAQYPQYLSILLGLLSLVLLVVSVRKGLRQGGERSSVQWEKWLTVGKMLLCICVAVLLMQWVGFVMSMSLLMLCTFFILGYARPLLGIAVSCLTAVMIYFIFTSVFSVPLEGFF